MIESYDVTKEYPGISIAFNGATIYGDRISIGTGVRGTQKIWLFDSTFGRLIATIPIELFTEDAIRLIKSFKNTVVIE